MITVDLLMATRPCEAWPRERVEDVPDHVMVRFGSLLVVCTPDLRFLAVAIVTHAEIKIAGDDRPARRYQR